MAAAMKLVLILSFSLVVLLFANKSASALNVGIQTTGTDISTKKECSRKCESEFCSVPPFLRYGKYCGVLYSGCPGEKPCDGLDACCMKHDVCIQARNNDYLNEGCNQGFLNCMAAFKDLGGPTFKENKCNVGEVVDAISVFIEAAVLAGRVLHKP
ncbi:hypothetical protein GIB67_027964 [Kingdonia uniflora]|uniref:phospholipase A2 n=1 Tax=Kingdonia uniflora TaxID=39325 RepID=A0A7J7LGK7_9MAGN|nr:hypothetical protein GIB67_027964 [Kingdonia uniflora]